MALDLGFDRADSDTGGGTGLPADSTTALVNARAAAARSQPPIGGEVGRSGTGNDLLWDGVRSRPLVGRGFCDDAATVPA